jgi:hypothetical protein
VFGGFRGGQRGFKVFNILTDLSQFVGRNERAKLSGYDIELNLSGPGEQLDE